MSVVVDYRELDKLLPTLDRIVTKVGENISVRRFKQCGARYFERPAD